MAQNWRAIVILLSDQGLSSGANNVYYHSLLHQRIVIIETLTNHAKMVITCNKYVIFALKEGNKRY